MENALATFRAETVREGNVIGNNMDFQKSGMKDTEVANVSNGILDMMRKDGLSAQDSFGRWMNYIIADSPGAIDDPYLSPEPLLTGQKSLVTPNGDHHESQVFHITEVSPSWALSNEDTKVLFFFSFNYYYFFHLTFQRHNYKKVTNFG